MNIDIKRVLRKIIFKECDFEQEVKDKFFELMNELEKIDKELQTNSKEIKRILKKIEKLKGRLNETDEETKINAQICACELRFGELNTQNNHLSRRKNELQAAYQVYAKNDGFEALLEEFNATDSNRDGFLEFVEREGEFDNAVSLLNGFIGQEKVKKDISSWLEEIANQIMMTGSNINNAHPFTNMTFFGNPGCGMLTMARIVSKLLYGCALLPQDKTIEASAKDLIGPYIAYTAVRTKEAIDKAIGGVLCITDLECIENSAFSSELLDELLAGMENHRDDLTIILVNPTFISSPKFESYKDSFDYRFRKTFQFDDYSNDELIELFKIMCSKSQNTYTPDGLEVLKEILNFERNKESVFTNARALRNIHEYIVEAQNIRVANISNPTKEQLMALEVDDFKKVLDKKMGKEAKEQQVENKQTKLEYASSSLGELIESEEQKLAFQEGLKMIDELKGIPGVKDRINSLIKVIEVNKKMIQNGLIPAAQTNSLVFSGGDTSKRRLVARALSKIFYGLGICKENRFVEANRGSLVSGYLGQTALNTRGIVNEALGGVLYIDDIQSLVKGGKLDFGNEAIDELLINMEEHRFDLLVIIGGEKEGLHSFVEDRIGFRARFNNFISFDD